MKRLLLLLLFSLYACKDTPNKTKLPENTSGKLEQQDSFSLEIYNYKGLEPLISIDDNNTHVVNFWATWCAPCVKELPHFEKLNAVYKKKGVEVLLVSLDFPRQYETKLKTIFKRESLTI